MNYEEAKATKRFLEEQTEKYSLILGQLEKDSQEYKQAEQQYKDSLDMLTFFDRYMLIFKHEYIADREQMHNSWRD